jgi:hypothetical protein
MKSRLDWMIVCSNKPEGFVNTIITLKIRHKKSRPLSLLSDQPGARTQDPRLKRAMLYLLS